jgi:hypothetical protein
MCPFAFYSVRKSQQHEHIKRAISLHFLPNFNLLLFPFILLSYLLFLSFDKLQLLNVEFLQSYHTGKLEMMRKLKCLKIF